MVISANETTLRGVNPVDANMSIDQGGTASATVAARCICPSAAAKFSRFLAIDYMETDELEKCVRHGRAGGQSRNTHATQQTGRFGRTSKIVTVVEKIGEEIGDGKGG